MSSPRLSRVAGLLVREVSGIIAEKLRDPRIGMATVMGAEVSADLANAKIFISVLGSQTEIDATLSGLNSAAPFVRRELGRVLTFKTIPAVRFVYDPTPAKAEKMDRLLDSLT